MRARRLARRRLGFDNPGLAPQGPQRIVDSAEYDNLAALERDHWYYAGKRRLVRAWIERLRPPSAHDVLLDCGAGTGLFAAEMERCCRVLVLDDHEESLRMLRARFPAGQVLVPVGGSVPLPDRSLDYLTALDVLEHIPDDAAAVRGFARLLRPGGLMVCSTLNRNPKSFLMAIIGAEWVMRWLPKGTHDWSKFITPDELYDLIRRAGLDPVDRKGMIFNPVSWSWSLSDRDLSVNYVTASIRR